MSSLNDLASIQRHLEDHAQDYPFSCDIRQLFEKIRDLDHDSEASCDAREAQWEMDFLDVQFDEGEAKRMDYEGVSGKEYDYLHSRLEATQNPILKARYSHILWCSPKYKHRDVARTAVDSYLLSLTIFENQQIENPTAHYGHNLLSTLINAHSLAYQTEWRTDEVKAEILRIILDFPFDNPASMSVRNSLIQYMLRETRKFGKDDFRNIDTLCWKLAEVLIAHRREELAVDFLDLGERVESKTGRQSDCWARKKAECHETLMERFRHTPNEFIHWEDALTEYRRVPDPSKVSELESKYYGVVGRMPVGNISAEVDLTKYLNNVKALAVEMAQHGADGILCFLSEDRGFLPNLEDLERIVEDRDQGRTILDLVGVGVTDERGHQAQHFTNSGEKTRLDTLVYSQIQLECFTIELVRELLKAGIEYAGLSAATVLEYLEVNTWIGRHFCRRLPGRRVKEYRWLDLVAPSVTHCMADLTAFLQNPSEIRHCVLGVDSLTLKLEGLLRDLCHSHGITTWKMVNDPNGKTIFRERDLKNLLYDPNTENLLDRGDHLFLRLLLVEQAGYNLRNRIAHALVMSHSDYTPEYCLWGLLALLRLAKYEVGDHFEVIQ